jgi:hypothetical protein
MTGERYLETVDNEPTALHVTSNISYKLVVSDGSD